MTPRPDEAHLPTLGLPMMATFSWSMPLTSSSTMLLGGGSWRVRSSSSSPVPVPLMALTCTFGPVSAQQQQKALAASAPARGSRQCLPYVSGGSPAEAGSQGAQAQVIKTPFPPSAPNPFLGRQHSPRGERDVTGRHRGIKAVALQSGCCSAVSQPQRHSPHAWTPRPSPKSR